MASLGTLDLGTYTDVSSTAIQGTDPVLEVIASTDDADYVYDATNSTHTGTARFSLGDVPADLGNVDTLSVQLRYAWEAGTQVNTWGSLTALVFKSDGVTALTAAATLASSITTTTITNSSVIAFTGVDTAATKADWNGAVVDVSWSITKSMAGDALQKRVFAGELTGTYTASTIVEHATSGALVGQGAVVAGSAARTRQHATSGTLTGAGAVVSGAAARATTFNSIRQAILNGIDSAQAEANGWDAERVNIPVTAVVRTSDTVVTITLPALSNYNITAQETLTVTVPASAVSSVTELVATPTFTVDFVGAVAHTSSGALVAEAVVTGAAARTRVHTSSGDLIGGPAIVTGTAARTRVHDATGVLVADPVVTGAADRQHIHDATGALVADAVITGAAARTRIHDASGALVAVPEITGDANRADPGVVAHDATGALVAVPVIAGTALHTPVHNATGALVAEAVITGAAARTAGPVSHDATGALVAVAVVNGSVTHNTTHVATGALVAVPVVTGAANNDSGTPTTGDPTPGEGRGNFNWLKKKKKPRTIRFSDYSTQVELARAIADASIPITEVSDYNVESSDSSEEDDAIIHALLMIKVID